MSVICSSSCAEATAPVEYHDLCDPEKIRHGYTYFALIECDYVFTDILDETEWETARTAGTIIVSPPSIIDIPVPTQESFEVTGCGMEFTGEKIYAINYLTYWMNSDLSDFEFYDAIDIGAFGYRLIWWNCQDVVFMDRNWVAAVKAWTTGALTIAADSPGFEFSVIQTPHRIAGTSNLAQWSMNLQVKTANMIKGAYLPGVTAVLI